MIFTKYIQLENKICVEVDKIKIFVDFDSKLGYFENHVAAAKIMARKLGWNLLSYGDCRDGYAFVNGSLSIKA